MSTSAYTAALDLGTTTLNLRLECDGKNIGENVALNPQAAWGADVLSRIAACPAALGDMRGAVIQKIREMLCDLLPTGERCTLTVAANTTMLHILAGIDPSPLGHAPFKPAWQGAKIITDDIFGGLVTKTVLLPHFSAFVGGDIVAGLLVLRRNGQKPPYLVADLGTNAEIALITDKKILCTSAAAGPAFEGGNMECGSAGISGAVDSVKFEDGQLCLTTISKAPAATICASGLIECVAMLLDCGIIAADGALSPAPVAPAALSARIRDDKFYLTPRVYISSADIRALQTAKAAVRSGIELLLHRAGLSPDMLTALCLAGTMGTYISPSAARRIGMFPDEKIFAVGNTALEGAAIAAREGLGEIQEILALCRPVMLGGTASFERKFIKNMNFGS